ncbi:MAG: gamma-glutamylcyclotransferase, partial [Thermoanaerobaculia bacterium]|nr:gamma-glutamylcyclotransferase [Thermoanaerobaculia bacterium]
MWIFGYGSLMWRPGMEFEERRVAFIEGWARRFWQGSTDHRGVPGAPGRVVTLLPNPSERCWGVAYRIADTAWSDVLDRLDYREKGGYERRRVHIRFPDGEPSGAAGLTYIATPANPNYLGPASLVVIAEQVQGASGPSGDNLDYVHRLASTLAAMGVEDEHVFELARLVAVSALARSVPAPQQPP